MKLIIQQERKKLLKIAKLKLIGVNQWSIEGSSELFSTREEALMRMKSKTPKKALEGRRFFSEKLNFYFRSNWEIELAEVLTDLEIKFEYEPERFYYRAERESYLPDFYLPESECFIEVKGYMDKRSYKRVTLFKKYYGKKYAFFLYEKDERNLVLRNNDLINVYIEIAKREKERLNK